LIGLSERVSGTGDPDRPKLFYLAANSMKYTHPAAPQEVLVMRAQMNKQFGGLFLFNVEASAGRNLVASGSLTLALVKARS
jgi:3-hydroxymyristoyl/3-hydroxydecanoyl-(acyl carrier protein) dehydratase